MRRERGWEWGCAMRESLAAHIHTLSMWARMPSWLLCLVVSLTRSFAWLASCSKSEPCEPCLSTPLLPLPALLLPALFCRGGKAGGEDCCRWAVRATEACRGRLLWLPAPPSEADCRGSSGLAELKLPVRASTLPTLGCRCRHVGLIGGTYSVFADTHTQAFFGICSFCVRLLSTCIFICVAWSGSFLLDLCWPSF